MLAVDLSRLSRLLIPLLIVLAVADRLGRVDGVVDGEHAWRQGHIAANVEMMLQRGVFAVPSTWNDDLAPAVYDFPAYQGIVAVFVRATGASPVLVAELLSVALFTIVAVLTAVLARLLGLSRAATAWAIVFLALSPLARYWFAAALPDDLALCCSVASIAGWLAAGQRAGRVAAAALFVAYAFAFVATLIKPPVYFPVACTIVVVAWRRGGWRGVRAPRLVGFVLSAVAGVVAMRMIGAGSGGVDAAFGSATPWEWYFGSLAERASLDSHTTVLARIGKQAVTIAGIGAAAVLWCARTPPWPFAASALRTWSAAAVLSSLLFLHVNVVHSYYQLPCTVPLALAAGGGAALLLERVHAWTRRRWPAIAAAIALLAATAMLSEKYLARLLTPSTGAMCDAGAFLQEHTAPDDFVVYGIAERDPNPAFLHFAQRHGRNVVTGEITFDAHHAAAKDGRRTVVYVPNAEMAATLLADARWQRLAEDERGVLLTARDRRVR